MPTARQRRYFRFYSWSLIAFTLTYFIAIPVFLLSTNPEGEFINRWALFGNLALTSVLAVLAVSTCILFFLNLGLVRKLVQQARVRRRLNLKKYFSESFKRKNIKDKILSYLTLVLTCFGYILIITVITVPIILRSNIIEAISGVKSIEILIIALFIIIYIVVGLSLIFFHYMRRGQRRLEIVSETAGSLSKRSEAMVNDREALVDISFAEYDEIAGLERTQIIADRQQSIKFIVDRQQTIKSSPRKSFRPTYFALYSRDFSQAKSALEWELKNKVDEQIDQLLSQTSSSNIEVGTLNDEYLQLQVPETSLTVHYQIDDVHHRIRILGLETEAGAPNGKGEG